MLVKTEAALSYNESVWRLKRCSDGLVNKLDEMFSLKTFSAWERIRSSDAGDLNPEERRSHGEEEEREPNTPPTAIRAREAR